MQITMYEKLDTLLHDNIYHKNIITGEQIDDHLIIYLRLTTLYPIREINDILKSQKL